MGYYLELRPRDAHLIPLSVYRGRLSETPGAASCRGLSAGGSSGPGKVGGYVHMSRRLSDGA